MKHVLLGIALALVAALSTMTFVQADPNHEHHPKIESSPAFDKLKSLAGTWQGTSEMHGKTEKVKIAYRVTSGGSAVEETFFPGTPKEMISMYHQDGKRLVMTHYCALGNQPRMQSKTLDRTDKLEFSFDDATGLKSKKDPYMGALTLTFNDDKTITQEWTLFENRQAKGTTVMSLKRKK